MAGATLEVAGGREVAQNTANTSPENKASLNPMEVKLLHLHKEASGADAEIVNHHKPHEYWKKKHFIPQYEEYSVSGKPKTSQKKIYIENQTQKYTLHVTIDERNGKNPQEKAVPPLTKKEFKIESDG